MIRLVVVVSLFAGMLAGCRITMEEEEELPIGRRCKESMTSQDCLAAPTHSDFKWLEDKVFGVSCSLGGCHDGSTSRAGKTDLRRGMSYAHLVNYSSVLEPTRKLVVPNDIEASYLMVMLADIPAAMAVPPASAPSVGYMPQGVPGGLCCQKLDAVERWIMAGAPNN